MAATVLLPSGAAAAAGTSEPGDIVVQGRDVVAWPYGYGGEAKFEDAGDHVYITDTRTDGKYVFVWVNGINANGTKHQRGYWNNTYYRDVNLDLKEGTQVHINACLGNGVTYDYRTCGYVVTGIA